MTRLRVGVGLGLWVLLWGSLALTNSQPSPLLLAGIVAVATVAVSVAIDLTEAAVPVAWTRNYRRRGIIRRSDPRATAVRQQVFGARRAGSSRMHASLVELVDDRLLVHHQINRQTDPQVAASVLTPRLQRLISSPRLATTTVRELRRIVTDIELL